MLFQYRYVNSPKIEGATAAGIALYRDVDSELQADCND
jgi:hypothetical protein